MKWEKIICMEDPRLEDEEVELSICDEDGHPSLCPMEDIDHLKDEDIQYELIGVCSGDPSLTVDNLSKDELYQMLEPFNLILDSKKVVRMEDFIMLSLNNF